VQLRRLAQQHSADTHTDPVERFTQRGWRGEIGLAEADLPGYLWHLLQQINCHPVGGIKVNPETMEGNEGIVGESAATFRGGGFVSIASNSLSNRDDFASEAGDLGHEQLKSPASTPSI
jgi:hypothetical protein